MDRFKYYARLLEEAPSAEISIGEEIDPDLIGLFAQIEDEVFDPRFDGSVLTMCKYGFTAVVPVSVVRLLVFVCSDIDFFDPEEGNFPEVTKMVDMVLSPDMAAGECWVLGPGDLYPFGAWEHDEEVEGDLSFVTMMLYQPEEHDLALLDETAAAVQHGGEPFLEMMKLYTHFSQAPNADILVQHLPALESDDDEWELA